VGLIGTIFELVHPLVGDFDGDVEVGEGIEVLFGEEEFEDVGMGDAEHTHVGAASEGALLDGVGGFAEDLPKADGSGGFAATGRDVIAGGSEVVEREAGAAAGFLDEGGIFYGVEDTVDAVGNGQDKTGAEHADGPPGIHKGGAVGEEAEGGHEVIELVLAILNGFFVGAELLFDGGDMTGDPFDKLFGGFGGFALVIFFEVAIGEDDAGIVGEAEGFAPGFCLVLIEGGIFHGHGPLILCVKSPHIYYIL